MTDVSQLITDHLDIWTSAIEKKSGAGRGNGGGISLYGIKKLRDLVLELAVQGKLVPQDPEEGNSTDLLEAIEQARLDLVKQKKVKNQKGASPVAEEEFRFLLPNGWAWTRLSSLAEISPRNDVEDSTLASFVPMPDIHTSHTGEHHHAERRWGEIKKSYTHFADGDIALAKITPCFENSKAAVFSNLHNGVGAGTTELHVARPYYQEIVPRFILLHLKAPSFLENGKAVMTGSAGQKRVPRWYFADTPIALPPTAEQHRIVAKVDELMGLCDTLEAQAADSLKAHQTLVETCLAALTNSQTPEDLTQNWARLEANFDSLFTTEESIRKLKLTVLKLATTGQLVAQSSEDQPASNFISATRTAKEEFENSSRRRSRKGIDKRASLGDLTNLPAGWGADFFGNLVFSRDSERVPLSVSERQKRQGCYDYYGASGVIDSIDDYLFDEPLLLIGEDGANLINRSTPIAFIARGKFWVNNHAHVLGAKTEIFLQYLEIYINSISLEPYVTGTAQPKMNQAKMNTIPVWVPPEAEQGRIVIRVHQLLAICDQLLAKLPVAHRTQRQLANSLADQVH
ncbi:restriction endonuclease subunit S [uncultured Tateyamaria sp.]|uniref:restriction endonuclease subunit S n=1 Tax=uncultured Tateyamaria sp. TaxID=455651 RepID=UPI00260B9B66|nr:restriction endonuclease subunit S [uncultured Tateyamaria sp.]